MAWQCDLHGEGEANFVPKVLNFVAVTARSAVLAVALVPVAAYGSSGPIGELLLLAFAALCGAPAVIAGAIGVFRRGIGYWRSLVGLAVVIALEFAVLAYIDPINRTIGPVLVALCMAALVHGIVYGTLNGARRLLRNTNPKTTVGDP
jgi:hypothetical protein